MRYPGARWHPIPRNYGGRRTTTRAVVLHVTASEAPSQFGWFSDPLARASSHFHVAYDGTVEQYVDTAMIAWTQRAGNSTCIGIETQGVASGSWRPAQYEAIVRLVRWCCEQYSLPMQDMRTSLPSARGIGIHRYGIDPWRVTGGQVWGPRGKECPGPHRVAQLPALIRDVKEVDDMFSEDDRKTMKNVADLVTWVHRGLFYDSTVNGKKYDGLIPATVGSGTGNVVGRIWSTPVHHVKDVPVLQEIADIRTEQTRQAETLTRIEANLKALQGK